MQMCNLCLRRWGQNKKPICVMACPTRALDAGPLEELRIIYSDSREAEGFTYYASTGASITFNPKRYNLQVLQGSKEVGEEGEKNLAEREST